MAGTFNANSPNLFSRDARLLPLSRSLSIHRKAGISLCPRSYSRPLFADRHFLQGDRPNFRTLPVQAAAKPKSKPRRVGEKTHSREIPIIRTLRVMVHP